MYFTCKVLFDYLCFKAWNNRVKHYRIGSTDQVLQMAYFTKVLLPNKQVMTSEKSFFSSYNTLGNFQVYPLLLNIVTTKLNTLLSSDHLLMEGNLEVKFFKFGQSRPHSIEHSLLLQYCCSVMVLCRHGKGQKSHSIIW